MDEYYEKKCHAHAETYWWFVGRHRIIAKLLGGMEHGRILDVGCAGGALLKHLRNCGFHDLWGVDISKKAVAFCRKNGFSRVYAFSAEKTSFGSGSFDAITASDVLEHVKNDGAAVREWRRLLKRKGKLILFVPAFSALRSSYDDVLFHYRRYDLPQLSKLLSENGFGIDRISYWNFLAFFPAATSIAIHKLMHKKMEPRGLADQLFDINDYVNFALTGIVELENLAILQGINSPIGLSLMVIARKKRRRR